MKNLYFHWFLSVFFVHRTEESNDFWRYYFSKMNKLFWFIEQHSFENYMPTMFRTHIVNNDFKCWLKKSLFCSHKNWIRNENRRVGCPLTPEAISFESSGIINELKFVSVESNVTAIHMTLQSLRIRIWETTETSWLILYSSSQDILNISFIN